MNTFEKRSNFTIVMSTSLLITTQQEKDEFFVCYTTDMIFFNETKRANF